MLLNLKTCKKCRDNKKSVEITRGKDFLKVCPELLHNKY